MFCFSCNGNSEENTGLCETCGKPFDADADRYFRAGMESLSVGDMNRSIVLLRDCLKLDPEHVSGRYNLGLALSLVDDCDEAICHYQRIAEKNPDYPGIYTAMGQAAFGSYLFHSEQAENRHNAMIHFLMRAVEQDSDDVDAHFSLGNAYIADGNAEYALPWLRCALRLHPDSPVIFYTMAKALKMLGEHSEAIQMSKESMRLSQPEDPFCEEIRRLFFELQEIARA